ncbi:MAG: FG-GAP-like repeat-containing protein, partial [Bdellovibrionota bacterium]
VTFFTGGVFDVSRDGNLTTDVYARDRLGRTTSLVSLRQDNTQAGDLPSDLSTMTYDGKVIVFQSNATDLLGPGNDSNSSYDIFVRRNPATDSFPSGGVVNEIASRQDTSLGNGESDSQTDTGAVSEDGRFVAFSTYASNLETPDLDFGLDQDVFVRDRLTNHTVYVSYDTASTVQGNGQSYDPAISADGRYVVYSSTASNLLPGDSGTYTDIYLFDLLARRTERISVGIGGAEANGENYDPEISPDGRFVVFESFAGNLAPNDANADNDVYLYDRVAGTTTLVSADMVGNAAGSSLEPVVSYDGRYVAFKSQNGGIVPGDTNGAYDIFVWDRIADQTERVSLRDPSAGGGETLAGAAHNPSISWDGTIVAFESLAGDMIASGTTPGRRHVYLHDRATLSTILASRTVSGAEAGGDSFFPSLSGDGTLVAFETSSDLLDGGDLNGLSDIYVSDLVSFDVARVSIDSAEPNGGSNGPAMAASGRYIAFRTDATNVAGTDTNGAADFAIVPNPLPSPLFQTRPPVTAVNGPQAVALGDMDRDGKMDAVVVFSSAASGQVFYGDGMGNLSAGPTFAATGNPRGVVLADFDRDGDLDIAISSTFSGSIELARNDGGGTFTGVAGPATAGNPWGIAAADFDGDGRVDIVVAREASNTVEIFQNQGGMTFASMTNFALGGSVSGAARDVVAGDFDRDGRMDFAATNGNTMDRVEVYLGNGTFGFAAAPFSPFATGGDPNELEAADFDGDGILDLAITNGFDGNVTVAYGDGTGAFIYGAPNTFPTGAGPYALVAGDFDKDGYPDLATTGQSSNDVSIRLGFASAPPSGTQDPDTPYFVGNNPVGLATADLDQDGALDLVLVEQGSDGLRVLLNTTPSDPPPSYAPAANYLTDDAPIDAALGDFNRDGKMDVAVACNLGFDSRVSFGNGSGGLVLGPQLAVPSFPLSIAAADVDNDGDMDVLTGVDASEIRTHLNNGTGAFSPAGTWTGITGACSLCYPHYLLTADFNRDGDMDVAAVLQDDSMVAIFTGDGSGSGSYTQQADVILPGGTNPGRFATADLDRDGILDLVIPGVLNGQIYAYKGDGLPSPGFTQFLASPFTAGDPRAVAIADLDGDGKLDLAVASGSGTGVYVFLGDGTGNFGPSSNYGGGNGFSDVVAVDADRDGDLDLFAARFTTDGLQPLYNDGTGVFSVGTFVSGLADPRKVLAVDLNRDGRPDAITPSNGGGMISVFLEQ